MKLNSIPISVYVLAIGAFALGLAEFLIIGLLPDVARDMNVSIAQAGHYVSIYALGVVVGALLFSVIGRNMARKHKLVGILAFFTLTSGLAALSQNSVILLIFRFLSGFSHATYLGLAGFVATQLVNPNKSVAALAAFFSGLALSNFIGVPFGTYIGQIYGWRISFGIIAALGLITLILIVVLVPNTLKEAPRNLKQEFAIFKNPILWYLIAFCCIGFAGFLAWFSYIVPILLNVTHVSALHIPYFMLCAGFGMIVGNWCCGRIGDQFSLINLTLFMICTLIILIGLNIFLVRFIWPMYVLTFLTAATVSSICVAIPMLFIRHSKDFPELGSTLSHTSLNLGNSIGAFASGIPLGLGYGFTSPWWVGIAFTSVGLIILFKLKSNFLSVQQPVLDDLNQIA